MKSVFVLFAAVCLVALMLAGTASANYNNDATIANSASDMKSTYVGTTTIIAEGAPPPSAVSPTASIIVGNNNGAVLYLTNDIDTSAATRASPFMFSFI
jgi:hypothetical protein